MSEAPYREASASAKEPPTWRAVEESITRAVPTLLRRAAVLAVVLLAIVFAASRWFAGDASIWMIAVTLVAAFGTSVIAASATPTCPLCRDRWLFTIRSVRE